MLSVRRCLFALLVLLGPAAAHAIDVYYCTVPGGDEYLACAGSTGVTSEEDAVANGWAVASCRGAPSANSFGACESEGGTLRYRYIADLMTGDTVTSAQSGEEGLLRPLADYVSFVGGGGDEDPPPDDGNFDFSDLDLERLGGLFSAGFVLVGMFWALGKAVSVVLGVVRSG